MDSFSFASPSEQLGDQSFVTPSGLGLSSRQMKLLDALPSSRVGLSTRRPYRLPFDPSYDVIFVRTGLVSKYVATGPGPRQVVALRYPGEEILPCEVSPFGIQAVAPSELTVVKGADFDSLLEGDVELHRLFRRRSLRHAAISYAWLANCGRRDAIARVAHLICETIVRSGVDPAQGSFGMPFTQQHMADITGQTAINVNRVMRDLQRSGLIERAGRQLEVLDWRGLQRVGGFEQSYLL